MDLNLTLGLEKLFDCIILVNNFAPLSVLKEKHRSVSIRFLNPGFYKATAKQHICSGLFFIIIIIFFFYHKSQRKGF